jgi:hypothetical protein
MVKIGWKPFSFKPIDILKDEIKDDILDEEITDKGYDYIPLNKRPRGRNMSPFHFKYKNPFYSRYKFSFELDNLKNEPVSYALSKYAWGKRFVPYSCLEKVALQLKESNEFTLSYAEWILGTCADFPVYAGYYEEIPKQLCRIKVTNTDRKRLIASLSTQT